MRRILNMVFPFSMRISSERFSLLPSLPTSLTLTLALTLALTLNSQDNTLYHMPVIPQANQLNPAYIYSCRTYIELPLISSIRLNVRNTGFGFHDIIHTGTGSTQGTYFLDLNNLDKKLMGMNYFLTNTDIDLLGFGFTLKDWYFTFGIINHTEMRISYPHDISSLRDGNWDVAAGEPIPLKLDGLGIDLTAWNSIGVSAAKELYEGLTVGVRLKYLQGMANFNTRRSKLEVNTNPNPISLEAEASYRLNVSFPIVLGYNSLGLVNSINADGAFNDLIGNYIFNKNRGVSVDAGLVYDIDENTSVSGSVTDLGFISWKKNVNNLEASGNYIFNGIDIDSIQARPGQADLLQALQDSLIQAFNAEGTTSSYLTMAPVKIFGGISHELSKKLNAAAMTRVEFFDHHVRPSLTLSLNYKPVRALAATLSYTIMNNKFNQVGAGIALGNKRSQFYILTDNIPVRFINLSGSPIIWPYNARMISLRFGFNLIFGCDKKSRVSGKDRCPAYW